jgi:hypothetical protein
MIFVWGLLFPRQWKAILCSLTTLSLDNDILRRWWMNGKLMEWYWRKHKAPKEKYVLIPLFFYQKFRTDWLRIELGLRRSTSHIECIVGFTLQRWLHEHSKCYVVSTFPVLFLSAELTKHSERIDQEVTSFHVFMDCTCVRYWGLYSKNSVRFSFVKYSLETILFSEVIGRGSVIRKGGNCAL